MFHFESHRGNTSCYAQFPTWTSNPSHWKTSAEVRQNAAFYRHVLLNDDDRRQVVGNLVNLRLAFDGVETQHHRQNKLTGQGCCNAHIFQSCEEIPLSTPESSLDLAKTTAGIVDSKLKEIVPGFKTEKEWTSYVIRIIPSIWRGLDMTQRGSMLGGFNGDRNTDLFKT